MGLEYIVQPQVFLGGLTALGPGIQNLTENYPLLTTYNFWTSTSDVAADVFPIPGTWSIYDDPNNSASFIVNVGGVVQSPDTYFIDTVNRTITFLTPIDPDIEVAVTQLATAAPSSQEFSFIKVLSGNFGNSTFQNVTATNLTILSSTVFNTTIFTFTTATNLTAVNNILATGTMVLDTSSSDTALRVTQRGSGDVIRIEDSANPDATPVIVNNIGQIISGTTAAFNVNAGLQITSDSSSAPNANIVLRRNTSDTSSANLSLHKARGTLLSPQVILSGDLMGGITFAGYDGTSMLGGTNIVGGTDGVVSSGSLPGYLRFGTRGSGDSSVQERMRISSTGNVGIGTTEPNQKLTVIGAISSTGTVFASGGNSNDWNYNTTLLQSNSANWQSTYETVSALSASWEESDEILPTVTNYLSTELITISSLNVTEQLLSANIPLHNIFLTSETDSQTLTFIESSLDLEITNGNIVNLSAINATFASNSSKYEEVYTIVQTNSSTVWSYQGTDLKDLSANWQSTYETVSTLSASWEESAEILPTVTDFLSTSNVQISGLSVESLTVVSSNVFQITTLANLVSALAVTVNGDTVYLPLLSAV
jgi:hypothetical protein